MSKQSLWLDERKLPWPVGRLKDHVNLINGFPFDSTGFNPTTGTPVVRIRDLLIGQTETFFDGVVPPEVLVEQGEVVVGMDGDFNAIVWRGNRAALNQRLCLLRAGESLNQRFLAYLIHLPLQAINAVAYYTTVKHLSSLDLLAERIPLPPLNEQQMIADYLDAETSRIDALIAKKQRMIDLMNERAQVVVARAFPTSLTYSTDGRPIGLAGVRCVRLGELARVQTALTLDGGKQGGADAVALPYLRVANVQDGSLDLSELKEVTVSRVLAARSTLRVGDVLMTEGGDPDKLGRGAVWRGEVTPCLHQNHIFAVRPNPNLLPDFLALVTRTPYAGAYFEMTASKTTGIASTSVSKIVSFHVPLPSIAEQAEAVRSTRSKLAQIDVLQKHVTEQIDLLVERRQALITAAITGELEMPGVAA